MVTKKIQQEIEIKQCDFCNNIASSNCWGTTCRICGRDLCDEHLIRPIKGNCFTVCPDCNKTDLSGIFKIVSEIDEAYNQVELKKKKLKNALENRWELHNRIENGD